MLALGFSVLLAGYVFMVAPRMHAAATRSHVAAPAAGPAGKATAGGTRPGPPRLRSRSSDAPAFPPPGRKFIGIMTNGGGYEFTDLDTFTRAVGYHPSVYEFAQGWAVNQFDASVIDAVAKQGMLPLISWEPWDYRMETPGANRQSDQPALQPVHDHRRPLRPLHQVVGGGRKSPGLSDRAAVRA